MKRHCNSEQYLFVLKQCVLPEWLWDSPYSPGHPGSERAGLRHFASDLGTWLIQVCPGDMSGRCLAEKE